LDIIGRLRVDNEKAFLIKKDYQELKILLAEDEKEYYNLKERFMKAVYGIGVNYPRLSTNKKKSL